MSDHHRTDDHARRRCQRRPASGPQRLCQEVHWHSTRTASITGGIGHNLPRRRRRHLPKRSSTPTATVHELPARGIHCIDWQRTQPHVRAWAPHPALPSTAPTYVKFNSPGKRARLQERISHEAQEQVCNCGRRGVFAIVAAAPAPGQVLAEIAERNRVLRLQGIRGLGGRLLRRTNEVLKVIVANPVMIKAYKAGVPGNGRVSRKAPRSRSSSGASRRVRRPRSSWMCRTPPRRLSS